MIKQEIICDKTGEVLDFREQVLMSSCTIQFKDVSERPVPIEGSEPPKFTQEKFVRGLENYAFHICSEHAAEFMAHVNKFFKKKVKK